MNPFNLDKAFENKIFLFDLKLCKVFLENDSRFPWIILVPMRNDLQNILDLSVEDRNLFWSELEFCSQKMKNLFKPDRLNIGMLGNVTKQMHCHIVCRYENDEMFPNTVWGSESKPYNEAEIAEIVQKIRNSLVF